MAVWVTVEDNEITGYYDTLPSSWRNISGLDKSAEDLPFLKSIGWYPVVRQSVDYDPTAQDISSFQYEIQSDQVLEIPVVTLKPGYESVPVYNTPSFEELKAAFMTQVRTQRNQRLLDCDYTQLVDIQAMLDDNTKAKWATYRQALRDFPAKYSDNDVLNIENVTWPEV